MNSNYIIDPSDSIARLCSENGLFLEDDYYMSMSHNEIPKNFWERVDKTDTSNRKIVIIGSYETPMLVTKSAFLAYALAKPQNITVKVSGKDEAILLEEMFKQNSKYNDGEYSVYQSKKDELSSSGAWLRDVEDATDVIVYGGIDTLSFFNMEPKKNRNVYLHKPKFSFGIVSKECLENEDNLAGLVGDFISFFGEGTLSPKFYITLGKLSDDQLIYIADCINNEQDIIKEFRAKLPLSKKSLIVHEQSLTNFIFPNVKKSNFDNLEFLSPLYGDVRLIETKNEEEIEEFVIEYEKIISSIAIEENTLGHMVAGWEVDIPRYCDIGSMQFPYFYEPYDEIDDMLVYGGDITTF